MKKHKVLIAQINIIVMFLLVWELGARLNIINTFIFSSPYKILLCLLDLIKTGNLFMHIYVTCKEIFIAFTLGIIIAFVMSVIMYILPFFAKVIDPFLTMLNSLPKVALGPIIIIWAGANTKSIIVMALLINVIISILTIYNGFNQTDLLKIKLFKTFNATKWQILFKLVIPESFPIVISSLKINISLTMIGVLMGEFLVSKEGIGYIILYGSQIFNLSLVLTGIFVLIIISYLIYKIVFLIEKRLLS